MHGHSYNSLHTLHQLIRSIPCPATGVVILPYISTFKVNRELDYNLLALTCHFAWFVATI